MAYGGKLMGMSAMVVSSQRDDLHALRSLVDAVLEFHVSFGCPDTKKTFGDRLHACWAWIGAQIFDQTFHSDALLWIEQRLLRGEVACHKHTVSMISGSGACHDGIA